MTSGQLKELVGLARLYDQGNLLMEKVTRMQSNLRNLEAAGADAQWIEQQKNALQLQYRQAQATLTRGLLARVQLEEILGNIRDGYLHTVITRHYLSGHSWRQIAMTLGGGNTPDGVRKAAARYLQEVSIVDIAQKV